MAKVLALTVNGDITWCTCPPELRGKGRCNHVAHQEEFETAQEFSQRIGNFSGETEKKVMNGETSFIPSSGAEITTSPYRMTIEEKAELMHIENRMQLDQNIDGGYIELDEPLWNDMDKSYFSQMSGIGVKKLDYVLHGEGYIVLASENNKFPEGKIISKEMGDSGDLDDSIILGTGVEGLNKYAKDVFNFEATKDVYVLPYYMRIGVNGENEFDEGISSDITVGYKYLLRNRNNPNRQQVAYEALLNNSALSKDNARYSNGYKNKSLADEFVGKGGVFRAHLSGGSIPYSSRTVVSPNPDLKYGEIALPPSVIVDIYRPTLIKSLADDGYSTVEIDQYFKMCRVPQTEVDPEIRQDLEERIKDKRVIMNRQPSLHTPSLQSYRPKVSPNATTQVNPLYCKGYNMDFDGDTTTNYGINSNYIVQAVDNSIDSKREENIHMGRDSEHLSILPSKEALWGLLNILDKRTI